ncbi:hypothetical protein [Streptomyces soliscabiei]|uniref:hypothetical protein n=1 Tax=Streptomyces soliscabiei TaxID=588897 RepID=UPI0029BB1A5C|nr:hypothetical protein [Streptomyces sp. NY05-11A]MDX2676961.1 hypothetical protein [Streptomyces sp. NY05-11A]
MDEARVRSAARRAQSSTAAPRGRDGCRVPPPLTGDTPPFGFSTTRVTPWLPQPADWKSYTAEANQADRTSLRLRLRRTNPDLRGEQFHWLDSPTDTPLFEHGTGLLRAINLSDQPIPLPHTTVPLLASGPLNRDGMLPPDTTVLLRQS